MKPTVNFYLVTLTLVAIFTILVIVFDCGFPCKLPQVQIAQINNVLLSLSTSAICSIIFYYILVYYPEKQRAKVIQSSINYNLEIIVNQMNWLFAIIAYRYPSLSEKALDPLYSNLNFDKLRRNLTLDIPGPMPIYGVFNCYQKQMDLQKERMFYTQDISIDFKELKNIIIQNLTTILSLPSTSLLDVNLVKNLTRLNTLIRSEFLTLIPAKNSDDQTTIHYTFSEIAEYYKIYLSLIKHAKPTVMHILILFKGDPTDQIIY